MNHSNSLPSNIPSILKRKPQNPLTRLFGNEFNTLHDARNDNMFDPAVLALGVLADEHGVDIRVRRLVALDGAAGTHVGEEREGAAQGQVEGDVAFADGGCEGAF